MTSNPLKYHGGKGYLASWLISLMPPRDTWHLWREPYFGGGAVTLALNPEGLSEAVNDINGDLVNFWTTLRDKDSFSEFCWLANNTALDQTAFDLPKHFHDDPSTNSFQFDNPTLCAWRFFIHYRQSRQGLGKDFATPTRRLRRGMNENVSAWLSAVEGLPAAHERLKRIEIRCMHAPDFIRKYDDEMALTYCDPPYVHEARHGKGANSDYEFEMSSRAHVILLATLQDSERVWHSKKTFEELDGDEEYSEFISAVESPLKGKFMLSGYRSRQYDIAASLFGWTRHEHVIPNSSSSKKKKDKKTECVWLNY